MRIGLYGETKSGKTRFLYGVCEAFCQFTPVERMAPEAFKFYNTIREELRQNNNFLKATDETNDNIPLFFEPAKLDITEKNTADTCTFIFKDWPGELLSNQVREWKIDPDSNKDLQQLLRTIQESDGFLYFVNPFIKGEKTSQIAESLNKELDSLRIFIAQVNKQRGNRFLPVILVITHADLFPKMSDEVKNLVDEWRKKAIAVMKEKYAKSLKNYYPDQYVSENEIVQQISAVRDAKETLPTLKNLWDLRVTAKNYRKIKATTIYFAVASALFLGLLLSGVFFSKGTTPGLGCKIDKIMETLQQEKLKPEELRTVLDFYDKEISQNTTQYSPEKVETLKKELDKRVQTIRQILANNKISPEEKILRMNDFLFEFKLEQVKAWHLEDVFNQYIGLQRTQFLNNARIVLESCEKVQTPPLTMLEKLRESTLQELDSYWIGALPDPNGKRQSFRKDLEFMRNFLDARISQKGYTVKMKADGKVGKPRQKTTWPYYIKLGTSEKEIYLVADKEKFSLHLISEREYYDAQFTLRQLDEKIEILRQGVPKVTDKATTTDKDKAEDQVSVSIIVRPCNSGNKGLMRLGMPLLGSHDFEFQFAGIENMWEGDSFSLKFKKADIPSLLLEILNEETIQEAEQ